MFLQCLISLVMGGHRLSRPGWNLGSMVQGVGYGVSGQGFKVKGIGFRV